MRRLEKYNKSEYFVAEVTEDSYWTHAECATKEEAYDKLATLKRDLHKIKDWAIIKRQTLVTEVSE